MDGTVLVVHHNVAVRSILAMRLERAGLRAICAGDGIEALAAVSRGRPDCVIVDLASPAAGARELLAVLALTPDLLVYAIVPSGYDPCPNGPRTVRRLAKGQALHPGFAQALRSRLGLSVSYHARALARLLLAA